MLFGSLVASIIVDMLNKKGIMRAEKGVLRGRKRLVRARKQ